MALSRSCVSLHLLDMILQFLTRTISAHEYVTLKVFVSRHRQADNEERVYSHLRTIQSDHPGTRGIRALLDQFQLRGRYGAHKCLVHEPLGLTLKDIREMSEGEKVDAQLLKPIIKYLLMSLDFLHSEARVVHTGKCHESWNIQNKYSFPFRRSRR